jgi:glycerol dehydrogenase-like iron-containing ADH family enzyme
MELKKLLEEREISLKVIEKPTYNAKNAPGKEIITNDDGFTKSLLASAGFENFHTVGIASLEAANSIAGKISGGEVLGVGGGKALDVAKRVASSKGQSLILFPTAPSHDGLFSKNCSLYDECRNSRISLPAKYPRKVIIPLHLWGASKSLRKAGMCDILSNLVALEDLSLAEMAGFPSNPYYREMSLRAVNRLSEMESDRDFAEALIYSGFSMEESSKYASGSEHEAERLLERFYGGKYLHGQLSGAGILISAKIYSLYAKSLPEGLKFDPNTLFEDIAKRMEGRGILEYALMPLKDPNFKPNILKEAKYVRPERYTLWNAVDSGEIDFRRVLGEILRDACN